MKIPLASLGLVGHAQALLWLSSLLAAVSSERLLGPLGAALDDIDQPVFGFEAEPRVSSIDLVPTYATLESGSSDDDRQLEQFEQAAENQLVDSLVNQLLSGQQLQGSAQSYLNKRREDGSRFYYYDVNTHLPPNSPYGEPANLELDNTIEGQQQQQQQQAQSIRGPVNDPEEFEAKLSQLTNLLNHKMSNSVMRQQLLMGLFNESTSPVDVEDLVDKLDKLLEDWHTDQQDQEADEEAQSAPSPKSSATSATEATTAAHTTSVDNELSEGLKSSLDAIEASTSEYIDHPLALFGHQSVQGGAGEGRQLLGPDGSFENIQVIKTDSAVPSYCDPPNPCPLGYTAKDGCLENFINSASFSREYQAKQRCSCDNEHSLFNCAAPTTSAGGSASGPDSDDDLPAAQDVEAAERAANRPLDKLDTLARTIQNRFGDLASVQKLISEQQRRQEEEGRAGPIALARNAADSDDSNYLVRSARKWSPELNYHKMELD